ncbi:MAG TPA: Uma2 family endonuclease, partial [Coleofasciculaceae cyanobacterium]
MTSSAASRELKPLRYSHRVPWVAVMVEYNSLQYLPTEEDLPETDNTPVDNELQILIPNLLRAILALLWASRTDWFLGVNLGIYYNPDKPAIGPDGFLSLGVPRRRS